MTISQGIHHITAIGSDPQRLTDFYTQVLGLRLVKKTVNQDDVSTYHLFFGDKTGGPGMDLTFFTFLPAAPGSRGSGQVSTTSLAVPKESLQFWQGRFDQHQVKHEEIKTRFDWQRLVFYDFDNQRLELVGVLEESLPADTSQVWTTREIGMDQAVRHFHSALLNVGDKSLVEPILFDVLGYEATNTSGNATLYRREGLRRAAYLEVEEDPSIQPGYNASGTVHHIAFGVEDEAAQLELRERALKLGLRPTQVINRYYFKSVYFRIPAGILFELATMGPGFTADEAEGELGQRLALPPFLEQHRLQIEAGLPPVTLKENL